MHPWEENDLAVGESAATTSLPTLRPWEADDPLATEVNAPVGTTQVELHPWEVDDELAISPAPAPVGEFSKNIKK